MHLNALLLLFNYIKHFPKNQDLKQKTGRIATTPDFCVPFSSKRQGVQPYQFCPLHSQMGELHRALSVLCVFWPRHDVSIIPYLRPEKKSTGKKAKIAISAFSTHYWAIRMAGGKIHSTLLTKPSTSLLFISCKTLTGTSSPASVETTPSGFRKIFLKSRFL